jgi:pyruvate dehydrogenase kinase 2/3/4
MLCCAAAIKRPGALAGLCNAAVRALTQRAAVPPNRRTPMRRALGGTLGPTVTSLLNPTAPAPRDEGVGDGTELPADVVDALVEASERPVNLLRMRAMLEWSRACGATDAGRRRGSALSQSAMFLYDELPVRVAQRIMCLDRLPNGLNLMPAVQTVRQWYVQSFIDLHRAEVPEDDAAVERFTAVLRGMWGRHGLTAVNVAKGVHELQAKLSGSAINPFDLPNMSSTLNQFHLGRIGLRFLIGHHLLLQSEKRPGFIGMLKEDVNLRVVAERAVADATQICARTYGRAPRVKIHEAGIDPFLHVPDHLYFCVLEAVKNSMRAVMDFHGEIVGRALPPIKIVIANSPDTSDAAIKISDEGGGISRANMEQIWSHAFSTAELAEDIDASNTGNPVNMPLAGLGLGLPSARCYARYFGGDLNVVSLEGHGTDVYVHIDKSGDQVEADSSPMDPAQIVMEHLKGA